MRRGWEHIELSNRKTTTFNLVDLKHTQEKIEETSGLSRRICIDHLETIN